MAKKDKKTEAPKKVVEESKEEEIEVEAVKLDRAEKVIVKVKAPPKVKKEDKFIQRL